jgi:two-component system KDP operon response regulator KdpE
MHRVLVVGERPEEAKALAFRLGLYGFEAAPSAGDVTLALRALIAFKPDAIILDLESSAREVFRLLERVAPMPIFVVGDAHPGDDTVWYLESGAADFLARPLSTALLTARLNSVLRRLHDNGHGVISIGDLQIDLGRHQVRNGDTPVPLTPTEFRLLQVLAENAGKACSHAYLLERVWGTDFQHCSHYLRLYVGYLRQKLEVDTRNPALVVTEWGVGYRLVAERARVAAPMAQRVRAALT